MSLGLRWKASRGSKAPMVKSRDGFPGGTHLRDLVADYRSSVRLVGWVESHRDTWDI